MEEHDITQAEAVDAAEYAMRPDDTVCVEAGNVYEYVVGGGDDVTQEEAAALAASILGVGDDDELDPAALAETILEGDS
jgi:hypothetical protein